MDIIELNGGAQAVMGLHYQTQSSYSQSIEDDENEMFVQIPATSTVATRCFCAPCESPDRFRNPQCEADTYGAGLLPGSEWCKECRSCRAGIEYETKSCRGSHVNDTANQY